jgi:glutamine synthetase
MTGSTAEKHDSFLKFGYDSKMLMEFDGAMLIKGETDASSFPSGSIRSTFEARGYTAWDMTSPAFIRHLPNGKTLCVPTAFISWRGEALDTKTPLLRSEETLSREATRLLHMLGEVDVKSVHSTLGAEQEFFLVDKAFYLARPDLVSAGRTLLGARPSKGQEMEDHYFGQMHPRVTACLQEVERIAWKLGIPLKTRHNEVSPSQYEMAPIFERSTIAADHNMLLMDILREVANQHNLVCLFHEKPFAFVNGSGKHNNWSMASDTGINLLDPGTTSTKNVIFTVFLACVLRAIHLHGDLLRAAVAVPGNDHRLGANEAPPAIISAYMGEELDAYIRGVFEGTKQAEDTGKEGSKSSSPNHPHLRLGIAAVPRIPKDTTDRNRTSPFAFTGNKFEFRAVGASQSCAVPTFHLNTIVADSIQHIASKIEARMHKGASKEVAIEETVSEALREHYPIVFNGNNYSQEWVDEARKRGLPILQSAAEALKVYQLPKTVALFQRMGVINPTELATRHEVLCHTFIKKLRIEANILTTLLQTQVLPSALKYLKEVATTHAALLPFTDKEATPTASLLKRLSTLAGQLQNEIEQLRNLLKEDHASHSEDENEHLIKFHPRYREVLRTARNVADELEAIIDDDIWPLPKYSEILLLK